MTTPRWWHEQDVNLHFGSNWLIFIVAQICATPVTGRCTGYRWRMAYGTATSTDRIFTVNLADRKQCK
ncbi:hypothetical protein DPQ12_16175 [Salmonella enterica subsp. enterica serovar Newport]|nr:hypothetical protein [Salmonella enterica subsp. enterica serovar Newport]